MPGNPMDAVDGCIECQFGPGAAIGVAPVPGLTMPGFPAMMLAGVTSMVGGVVWQAELAVAFAAGPVALAAFLPTSPSEFFNDVFAEPWLSGLPQPLPETEVNIGGVFDFTVPEMDNFGHGAAHPELYGPGSSWQSQIAKFFDLLAILMALPFLAFWNMVTSLIDDPGTLPQPPTRQFFVDLFNDLAVGAALPPDSGVGQMAGCYADMLMAVV